MTLYVEYPSVLRILHVPHDAEAKIHAPVQYTSNTQPLSNSPEVVVDEDCKATSIACGSSGYTFLFLPFRKQFNTSG
jgi:hypothetical protein